MEKRLLIIARDFNAAKHWALEKKMSPGAWVYVSGYHNIQGNIGSECVMLDGWELRPDADLLIKTLEDCECFKKENI